MLSKDKVDKYNKIIMNRLSVFLNIDSDFIKKDMIEGLVNQCKITEEEAYAIVLSEVCGFNIEDNDTDMEIYQDYFPYMIKCLDQEKYLNNPYYKNIKIPEVKNDTWELKNQISKAYEAFVYDDMTETYDERVIKLFNEYILPQFKNKDKVRVINDDAFTYAKEKAPKENYEVLFRVK